MNSTQKNPPPVTEDRSALDLLTEIALLKESGVPADLDRAGELFGTLLETHGKILWALAHRVTPFRGSKLHLEPDDLYAELTVKIWKNPDQFNPTGSDAESIRKQFTGWASTILQNIVRDTIAPLKLEFTSAETLELGWDEFIESTPEPSKRAKIVAEILDEMDPDDAEILRWTAMVKPLDGSQMRPDPADRLAICRKLNVTEAGLRKKRERALNALRDELQRREA